MNNNVDMPISHGLTNTNITRAELKVNQTAEVADFTGYFVTYVCVEWVLVVWIDNFGNGIDLYLPILLQKTE